MKEHEIKLKKTIKNQMKVKNVQENSRTKENQRKWKEITNIYRKLNKSMTMKENGRTRQRNQRKWKK